MVATRRRAATTTAAEAETTAAAAARKRGLAAAAARRRRSVAKTDAKEVEKPEGAKKKKRGQPPLPPAVLAEMQAQLVQQARARAGRALLETRQLALLQQQQQQQQPQQPAQQQQQPDPPLQVAVVAVVEQKQQQQLLLLQQQQQQLLQQQQQLLLRARQQQQHQVQQQQPEVGEIMALHARQQETEELRFCAFELALMDLGLLLDGWTGSASPATVAQASIDDGFRGRYSRTWTLLAHNHTDCGEMTPLFLQYTVKHMREERRVKAGVGADVYYVLVKTDTTYDIEVLLPGPSRAFCGRASFGVQETTGAWLVEELRWLGVLSPSFR
jgi:hypothetical protein